MLQDEHLDVLPNGSHLSFGAYQEESRPLRRVLKQVGGGSIQSGLLAVQHDQNALRELASALCLDAKVLALPSRPHSACSADSDALSAILVFVEAMQALPSCLYMARA